MRRSRTLLLTTAVAAALGASTADAAQARSCPSVDNPFAGTEYDGVDLSHITATATSCATARRTARGAQTKALGMTPTGPIRRFTWNGWKVRGDLRPASDTYTARKGSRVVRWRF